MTYTRVFYLAKVGYGFDRMLYPQSLLPTRPPHAFLTGESNNSTLPKNLNAWSLHFLKNFTINTWRCCASTSCVGAIAKHVGRKSSGNIACCNTMRGDSQCNSEQKNHLWEQQSTGATINRSNNQPEQQSTGATINQSNNQQPPRWYGDDDGMKTVATWRHGNCGNNDAMTAASMHGDCGTATVTRRVWQLWQQQCDNSSIDVRWLRWWRRWLQWQQQYGDCDDTTERQWCNSAAMMQQCGNDATVRRRCNSAMMMAWRMRQGQHGGDYSYDGTVTAAMTMQRRQHWWLWLWWHDGHDSMAAIVKQWWKWRGTGDCNCGKNATALTMTMTIMSQQQWCSSGVATPATVYGGTGNGRPAATRKGEITKTWIINSYYVNILCATVF